MPNPSILDTPAANRPFYKRFTIVFGALTAAIAALEGSGVLPGGTATEVGKAATSFLTLIGIYRQVAN